jgi:hypothetical protein
MRRPLHTHAVAARGGMRKPRLVLNLPMLGPKAPANMSVFADKERPVPGNCGRRSGRTAWRRDLRPPPPNDSLDPTAAISPSLCGAIVGWNSPSL